MSYLQTDTASRRQKDGSSRQLTRPQAVSLYQQNFRGVDVCDQLRAAYGVGRASKKWWKYLLHFMLNMSIINGFVVMIETPDTPVERRRYWQLNFRLKLAQQLINGFCGTSRSEHTVPIIRGGGPVDHSLKRLKRKRSTCKTCIGSQPKRRKDTVFGCVKCDVHLCSVACLLKYHVEEWVTVVLHCLCECCVVGKIIIVYFIKLFKDT